MKRLGEFQHSPEAEIAEDVGQTLKRARVTVSEFDMCQAVMVSLSDPHAGKTKLNEAIRMMEKAQLLQSDINNCLWALCSNVLRGISLRV